MAVDYRVPCASLNMKHEILEPDDTRLREVLREARTDPPLPPRFQEAVWRRVETATSVPVPLTWLEGLVERLLRPRVALAGMATVMLIGALAGVMSGMAGARENAQARYLAAVSPHP